MRRVRIAIIVLSLLTFSVQVSASVLFTFCEHAGGGGVELSMSEHAHHGMATDTNTHDQKISSLVCDCPDGCGVGCAQVSTPTIAISVVPLIPRADATRYLVTHPAGLHDAYAEPFLRPPASLLI